MMEKIKELINLTDNLGDPDITIITQTVIAAVIEGDTKELSEFLTYFISKKALIHKLEAEDDKKTKEN